MTVVSHRQSRGLGASFWRGRPSHHRAFGTGHPLIPVEGVGLPLPADCGEPARDLGGPGQWVNLPDAGTPPSCPARGSARPGTWAASIGPHRRCERAHVPIPDDGLAVDQGRKPIASPGADGACLPLHRLVPGALRHSTAPLGDPGVRGAGRPLAGGVPPPPPGSPGHFHGHRTPGHLQLSRGAEPTAEPCRGHPPPPCGSDHRPPMDGEFPDGPHRVRLAPPLPRRVNRAPTERTRDGLRSREGSEGSTRRKPTRGRSPGAGRPRSKA